MVTFCQSYLEEDSSKTYRFAVLTQRSSIAYYIAFGPHGPRAVPDPREKWQVLKLFVYAMVASAGIFALIRMGARPPPSTMNQEWQEATNEYLRVSFVVQVLGSGSPYSLTLLYSPKMQSPLPASPPKAMLARARCRARRVVPAPRATTSRFNGFAYKIFQRRRNGLAGARRCATERDRASTCMGQACRAVGCKALQACYCCCCCTRMYYQPFVPRAQSRTRKFSLLSFVRLDNLINILRVLYVPNDSSLTSNQFFIHTSSYS